jgi:hypothetical protein
MSALSANHFMTSEEIEERGENRKEEKEEKKDSASGIISCLVVSNDSCYT